MSGIFDQVINYAPPSLLKGTVTYKGTWSAATNTPTLINPPDSTTNGFYYVVSAGGTQFSLVFNINDWIISNGSAWQKVDNTDSVDSVFGRTGTVVGVSTDYSSVGITATAVGASNPSTVAATTITATSTIAATGAVTGSNLSGTNTGDQTITLTGGVTGSGTGSFAATVVTNANLTGDVTSAGNATTLTNAPVIAKVLTGYVSGAGTVAATDSILQAIQKLNGNDATNANLTGVITSVGNATSIASQTGTGTKFVVDTSPVLVTPNLGTPSAAVLTSATGLPLTTGVTGILPAANGGTGVTTSTGTTNVVLSNSPTLVTPILGTPASGTVTNLTGTASININGTVGATTPAAGSFTTLKTSGATIINAASSISGSTFETNGDISVALQGSGQMGINIQRNAGTTVSWYNYCPSGSTDLRWYNSGEQMILTSAGVLLLGTTGSACAGSAVLGLNINKDLTSSLGIGINTSSASGTQYFIGFGRAGSICGQIYTTGTNSTTYATSSDYRLKNVIGKITNSGKFIDALNPIEGTWKLDNSKFVGFLAHEFAEVSPSSVGGEKDAVDTDGKPVYQSMQAGTSEVIANLVAELQSLRKRLAALETK